MLNKGETITFYVCLSLLLVGGLNWGIQAFSGNDILALVINNAANKTGGSSIQDNETVYLTTADDASFWAPRVVYLLVFASVFVVAGLLFKSAFGKDAGDSVVPALSTFAINTNQ